MAAVSEMQCPHCRKSFSSSLLGPDTARAGYKCPHCRLFVPLSRAEAPEHTEAA